MSAVPQSTQPPQATPAPTEKKNPYDCTACRLTGAAAFTGAGGYALYQAHLQGAFAKTRPKGSPVVAGGVSAAIGVVMIGLGIGRLFI